MNAVRNTLGMYKRVFLGTVALAVACLALLMAVSAPTASAGAFCSGVYLTPYGQAGDRCWGPAQKGLFYADIVTYERAGCVNIADVNNNLTQSWVCGAAGSAPGVAAQVSIPHSGLYYKGVIRNNNTSQYGVFKGGMACNALYPC